MGNLDHRLEPCAIKQPEDTTHLQERSRAVMQRAREALVNAERAQARLNDLNKRVDEALQLARRAP
jgi:hypothetical protein